MQPHADRARGGGDEQHCLQAPRPGLGGQTHDIKNRSRGINYGSNKVRFTSPVPVGSRVRLKQKLLNVEDIAGGGRLFYENQIEIEGSDRPALIAETIALAYD